MVQSTVNSMIVTIYIISVMLLTVDWAIISKVGSILMLNTDTVHNNSVTCGQNGLHKSDFYFHFHHN